jgi:hypothetical protein
MKYTTAKQRKRARTWRGWDGVPPVFREYVARLDIHLEAALGALQAMYDATADRGVTIPDITIARQQACPVLEKPE